MEEAKVGVEDIGLLRGYGIYDGLAVFNGKVFHFADHWNRMLSGAHILNLNVPITEEKAEKIIEELDQKEPDYQLQRRPMIELCRHRNCRWGLREE